MNQKGKEKIALKRKIIQNKQLDNTKDKETDKNTLLESRQRYDSMLR